MKNLFLFILFFVGLIATTKAQYKFEKYNPKEATVSKEEFVLYELINAYRKEKKLSEIKLSKALCHVAKVHAKDLELNLKKALRKNLRKRKIFQNKNKKNDTK